MTTGAVLYEVTVRMAQAKDAAEFARWMRDEHIPAVLATGLIRGAEFARADDTTFRTRYTAASRDDLERYLRDHSPGLRDQFAARFGDRATASREFWEPLQTWP